MILNTSPQGKQQPVANVSTEVQGTMYNSNVLECGEYAATGSLETTNTTLHLNRQSVQIVMADDHLRQMDRRQTSTVLNRYRTIILHVPSHCQESTSQFNHVRLLFTVFMT